MRAAVLDCRECAFWHPDEKTPRYGWCRRHAPQVTDGGLSYFPRTKGGHDWCAEGVPRAREQ